MKISKFHRVFMLMFMLMFMPMFFSLFSSGCTEVGSTYRAVEEEDEEELQKFDSEEKQQAEQTRRTVDFKDLDETVLKEMNKTHTPGAAIAIVSGNEIVFSRGYGVSDVETGAPVTPNTLFRIGSVTKMYTAAALVMLAEEGKLDLNAPVGNYVEGLSPGISKLTVNQLLTHTAGLRDEIVSSSGRQDEFALSKNVRSFNDSLFFTAPGEIFSYSNPGYAIAGLVLEETGAKVVSSSSIFSSPLTSSSSYPLSSGFSSPRLPFFPCVTASGCPTYRPYDEQVRERIFLPLGMNRTTFRLSEAVAYPYSQGHYILPNGTAAVVRPFPDNGGYWPAGFMFSNVNDLSRFAIAFMNEGELEGKKVLSPSLIQELSTPRTPVLSGYNNGSYGYGLYLYEHRGVKVVGHEGGLEGFTCQFLMVPEYRFAVIVLTNTYGSELTESTEKAMELFLPLDAKTPANRSGDSEKNVSLQISEEELDAYEGSYFNTPDISLELVGKGGQLFLKLGELEAPVKKVGEQRFATYHPLTQQPVEFMLVPGEDRKTVYLHIARRALKKI